MTYQVEAQKQQHQPQAVAQALLAVAQGWQCCPHTAVSCSTICVGVPQPELSAGPGDMGAVCAWGSCPTGFPLGPTSAPTGRAGMVTQAPVAEQWWAQGWGHPGDTTCPLCRGSRQALARQKNKVYFPSGCTCTTSAHGAATPSPLSTSTPAAHGPLPVQPRGAGTPSLAVPFAGSTGHGSILPPRCQPHGWCQCGPSPQPGARLPPSGASSSLPPHCGLWGWRAWAPLALLLSQAGAAGPRLISVTLAAGSPPAPSGSCPRGPSGCPLSAGC